MEKTCFVVSPIGNEDSDTRLHADNLFKFILEPACTSNDFDIVRVDHISTPTAITDDIFNHLKNDDLVIVDITELNPNVFLELGYRYALNKPVIIIKDKDVDQKFPFDIQHIRIFEYSLELQNIDTSKKGICSFIKNTNYSKNNIVFEKESPDGTIFTATLDENGFSIF